MFSGWRSQCLDSALLCSQLVFQMYHYSHRCMILSGKLIGFWNDRCYNLIILLSIKNVLCIEVYSSFVHCTSLFIQFALLCLKRDFLFSVWRSDFVKTFLGWRSAHKTPKFPTMNGNVFSWRMLKKICLIRRFPAFCARKKFSFNCSWICS